MQKRILAVASSGGHWTQLLRLMPVFEGHDVSFVSTNAGGKEEVEGYDYYTVTNATRKSKFNFAVMFFEWLFIILKIRPHVIITTGSAPGMVALAVGKLLGRRTIWIDSIANVEQLSSSGKIARRFADLYLTQWESLASPGGPQYMGSVL